MKNNCGLYLHEQEVPYIATERLKVLKVLFMEKTDYPDFTARHADRYRP
ncbi:hypothetical protein ACWHAM_26565 [Paenibacillus terrae]